MQEHGQNRPRRNTGQFCPDHCHQPCCSLPFQHCPGENCNGWWHRTRLHKYPQFPDLSVLFHSTSRYHRRYCCFPLRNMSNQSEDPAKHSMLPYKGRGSWKNCKHLSSIDWYPPPWLLPRPSVLNPLEPCQDKPDKKWLPTKLLYIFEIPSSYLLLRNLLQHQM